MDEQLRRLDCVKGCLLGGAIGDALGKPVKDLSLNEIKIKYGVDGIGFLVLNDSKKALGTNNIPFFILTLKNVISYFSKKYFAKDNTSLNDYLNNFYNSWLNDNKNSLHNYQDYNLFINIAILGLIDDIDIDLCLEASNIASKINDNPLNYLACQYYVLIIHNIVKHDGRSLWRIAKDALKELSYQYDKNPPKELEEHFKINKKYVPQFVEMMKKTLILVKYDLVKQEDKMARDETQSIIESFGKGYSTPEALAIALFSALRYQSEPEKGIRVAVNHSGNSVFSGTLAGQLLGAYYGEAIIPPFILDKIKLVDELEALASDLVKCTHLDTLDEIEIENWKHKYL